MKSIFIKLLLVTLLVASAQAAPPERILQLDDGMPLIVTPTTDISSADDETGQLVTFSLVQDCKVDGIVLISKGTIVNGKIEKAEHSKMFGKKGVLEISLSDTTAVDGSELDIRTTLDRKGNVAKDTADKIHSVLPYGAGMLFNGKDAILEAGTSVTIFVDGTSKFKIVGGKKAFRIKN
jgi:hypothetical protein